MLLSCGNPDTLEKIMSTDRAKEQIMEVRNEVLSQNGEIYGDYSIEVKGNEIIYKYYFIPGLTDEELATVEETLREDSTWSDTIGSVKDDIEQASSIRPATITFAYYSSEGGEVFKVTE